MTTLSLEQQRAIDRLKEVLVPAAEKFLDDAGIVDFPKKDFGDSQFRNLIAIANETSSPAVVLNFIRYQIGRDSREKNWRREHGGQRLGERLLADLKDGAVQQALTELAKVPGLKDDKNLQQLANIELIRQYLGFASRYLKYLDLQRR